MSAQKPPKTFGDEAKLRVKLGLLFGLPGLAYGIYQGNWIISLIAVVFLVEAVLFHFRSKLGAYLSILLFVVISARLSWLIATDGVTTMRMVILVVCLVSIWGEWLNFGPVIRGAASWDDPSEPEEFELDDEEDLEPMISIVLLQRKPRSFDEPILTEILRDAWSNDFATEEGTGFVVGEDPVHMIQNADGFWILHNHPVPYGEREEMVEGITDLRMRSRILEHEAWLSVDLIRPLRQDLPPDCFYPYIFRLIRELADEDTLLIYRPETGQVNVWDEEVAKSLGTDDPLGNFNEPKNVPVIPVSADDPRMKAAVAEARSNFHRFRELWDKRQDGDTFNVKAPVSRNDHTEFIWIDVTGLEPDYIHGTLANDPVNLEGLVLGSPVEVRVDELNDWMADTQAMDEPQGLYTLKVVNEVAGELKGSNSEAG